MQIMVNKTGIDLVEGDITQQETEAIVNAANSALAGGGGVDGAIHRAAGADALQAACRPLKGCQTGDAKITPGFRLKAKYIIHAVGPMYHPADDNVPRLLASAYRRSLEVAVENGIKTVAFPSISTGVYGYPMQEAAEIALHTAIEFATEHPDLDLIRFVLFGRQAYDIFERTLQKLAKQADVQ